MPDEKEERCDEVAVQITTRLYDALAPLVVAEEDPESGGAPPLTTEEEHNAAIRLHTALLVDASLLWSFSDDLVQALTPRSPGGQQVGSRPGLRSSLGHLIRAAHRMRDRIGWDPERGVWR